MKRFVAGLLAFGFCLSLCACGSRDNVREAEALIRAIGEVDADSAQRIEDAERAYNALSDKEKQQVESAFYLPIAKKALARALEEKDAKEDLAESEQAERTLLLSVQGDWDVSEDFLPELAKGVDMIVGYVYDNVDLSFSDFFYDVMIHATWRLRPNMTYSIFIDEEALTETLGGMREGLMQYLEYLYRHALWQEYWDRGYRIDDPDDDDAWRRKMGASFGEITEAISGVSLEEELGMMADEISYSLYNMLAYTELASGNYKLENGKLFLSDTLDDAVKEDQYVSFSLADGKLIMTSQNGIEVQNSDYPVTLERKDKAASA